MDVSRETLKMIFGEERLEEDFHGVVEELIKNPEEYRKKVLKYYENEKAENPEVCKECGGLCCKRAPCHWSPDDITDLSYRGLKKLLKKKKYISIVQFPGDICESALREIEHKGPYYYILRTRYKNSGIATIAKNVEEDDYCMLLTPKGCTISFEERPKGARLLIPEKERRCRHLYDRDDCVYDWKDYQEVLEKLFRYFRRVEMVQAIINNKVYR